MCLSATRGLAEQRVLYHNMNMINSNKVDFNSIIVKGDLNATAKHWMWDTQKLRSKKWHTIMTHRTPFTVVKSNQ